MPLDGTQLESLTALIKDAYNSDSLAAFVRFKMNADMYKEWVPKGLAFKYEVIKLLTELQKERKIAEFLECMILDRVDLNPQLTEFRAALDVKAASAVEQAAAINSSVVSMTEKLQLASVRGIVTQSKGVLTELSAKIDLLRTYKALHDTLHNAKLYFRSMDAASRQMVGDPKAIHDFRMAVTNMETLATSMTAIVLEFPSEPSRLRQDEQDWLERFNAALAIARGAADSGEHIAARQGAQGVRTLLMTEPSRIDGRLSRTADEIDLAMLKELFAAAAAVPELVGDAPAFEHGKDAAQQLLFQVKDQINQHAQWQAIDRKLAGAEDIMRMLKSDELWDFDALWKGLKDDVSLRIAFEPEARWAKKIMTMIAKVDATRAASDWLMLKDDFDCFRQETTAQFFVVDIKLKTLSTQVNIIGAPLRTLLEKL